MSEEVENLSEVEGVESGSSDGGETSQTDSAGQVRPDAAPDGNDEKPDPTARAADESAEGADEKPAPEAAAQGDDDVEARYQPNTKIKVLDKEYDIPEKFHSLMQDEESEKEVRELFEKAHGLDVVKNRLGETRNQLQSVTSEYDGVKNFVGEIKSLYQSGVQTGNLQKLDQFFQKLNIPEQVLQHYVARKYQISQLPEDQRAALEQRWKAENSADTLSQENQRIQSQMMETVRQAKSLMLEQSLARPDVLSAVQKFESFTGKPGSFKDAVIYEGQLEWQKTKQDLSVPDAINRALQRYGLTNLTQASGSAAGSGGGGNNASGGGSDPKQTVIVRDKRAATMPNVQGRGSSPIREKPKTIEDLKKLAARAAAAG